MYAYVGASKNAWRGAARAMHMLPIELDAASESSLQLEKEDPERLESAVWADPKLWTQRMSRD